MFYLINDLLDCVVLNGIEFTAADFVSVILFYCTWHWVSGCYPLFPNTILKFPYKMVAFSSVFTSKGKVNLKVEFNSDYTFQACQVVLGWFPNICKAIRPSRWWLWWCSLISIPGFCKGFTLSQNESTPRHVASALYFYYCCLLTAILPPHCEEGKLVSRLFHRSNCGSGCTGLSQSDVGGSRRDGRHHLIIEAIQKTGSY